MAQYFFDPNDWEVGDGASVLPFSVPASWSTFEIEQDSHGEKYLRLKRTLFDFEAILFEFVPEAVDAEVYLDSFQDTGQDSRNRSSPVIRSTVDGLTYYTGGFFWSDLWVVVRRSDGTNNVLSKGGSTVSTERRLGNRFRVNGADLKTRIWFGDEGDDEYDLVGNEPTTWTNEITDSVLASAGLTGMLFAGDSSTDFTVDRRVYFAGIGTDGDPAPTGPLSTTEAFALRHNPRTNKVIPVLSSPTVTDIGAACVRPRVTKGY